MLGGRNDRLRCGLQVYWELAFKCLSSCPSEYVFQFLRCADRTSSTFSCLSAEQLMTINLAQLHNSVTSELEQPASKRNLPRGQSRRVSGEAASRFPWRYSR